MEIISCIGVIEVYEVVLFIIILVLLINICIFKNICSKVELNSENIEKLKMLNRQYMFKTYYKRNRKIRHQTKSVSSLRKLTFDQALII